MKPTTRIPCECPDCTKPCVSNANLRNALLGLLVLAVIACAAIADALIR